MPFIVLFILNTVIWGTTWLAIKYQVEFVSPLWSVIYRFGLAAVLLLGYCVITRRNLVYNRATHLVMVLQGLFFFCLNYVLYYIGSVYLISGLVALIGACTIFFNILNSRLFFKMSIVPRVVMGACLGLLGLIMVFGAEIWKMYQHSLNFQGLKIGVLCCVLGALTASLGSMAAVQLNRMHVPMLQGAAISMVYGTFFTLLLALVMHSPPHFSLSLKYLISLLYLVVFGTIIAFGCYLTLLNTVGPAQAAYISIITPVIALLISTLFEDFHWTTATYVGMAFILLGNVLVLTKRNPSSGGALASK